MLAVSAKLFMPYYTHPQCISSVLSLRYGMMDCYPKAR